MQTVAWPIFLFAVCVIGLAAALLLVARLFNPIRPGPVKRMPYESGMDPFHDTRRRFDVRFYLLAIAFMVFDVELLFLYPWAVATRPARLESIQPDQIVENNDSSRPATPGIDAAVAGGLVQNRNIVFAGAMVFIVLLTLGYVYDWRKGIFHWR
jgi:NADH-quinone oxidoreductase subunit A